MQLKLTKMQENVEERRATNIAHIKKIPRGIFHSGNWSNGLCLLKKSLFPLIFFSTKIHDCQFCTIKARSEMNPK